MRKCMCCNQENTELEVFEIKDRKDGSMFEYYDERLELCPVCAAKVNPKWFDEQPTITNGISKYKYENDIIEFVDTEFKDPNSFWLMGLEDDETNEKFSELLDRLEGLKDREFHNNWENAYIGIDLEAAFTID